MDFRRIYIYFRNQQVVEVRKVASPAVQRVLTGPVAVLAHDLLVEARGGQLLADVAVGDAREAQSDRRLHFVVRIAAAAARGSQCHARRDRHPAFIPRIRRQFHNTTL